MYVGQHLLVWIITSPHWVPLLSAPPDPRSEILRMIPVDQAVVGLRSTTYLEGAVCNDCQRVKLVNAAVLSVPDQSPPNPDNSFAGRELGDPLPLYGRSPGTSCPQKLMCEALCPRLHASDPVTQSAAKDTLVQVFGQWHEGFVPIKDRRLLSCTVPQTIDPDCSTFVVTPDPPPAEVPANLPPSSILVVVTMNCGGAAQKSGDILATAGAVEADIVLLQELWEAFDPEDFRGSPYVLFYDEVKARAAGTAVLILYDLQAKWSAKKKPHTEYFEDHQVVQVFHRIGFSLLCNNVYCRPGQRYEVWQATRDRIQGQQSVRNSTVIVGGDLNEDLSLRGRVTSAIQPQGKWAFLMVPYERGEPTNVVRRQGAMSKREIDYILISVESPLTLAQKQVLPGVSTHGALVCHFQLPESLGYEKNVTGKKLDFRRAESNDVALLAAHASLFFWFHKGTQTPIDDQLAGYHEIALQLIPRYAGRVDLGESQRMRVIEERGQKGDKAAATVLEEWKQKLRDRACPSALGIRNEVLEATSVTPLVAKAFKTKPNKFKVVTEVSRDGKHFASSPGEFKFEARRQAMELYCLRNPAVDWQELTELSARSHEVTAASDDLCMQDQWLQQASTLTPPHPLARAIFGPAQCHAPVTEAEWRYQLTQSSSQATSLEEMPDQVVRSMPWFGLELALGWLQALRTGAATLLLVSALHLCLLKKKPHYLIRNSRPIVLEPDLKRKESSCMFRRMMSRAESCGFMPPWSFAYRKEISPVQLAIWVRWFTAYQTVHRGSLLVTDWDESNAFCNVNRSALNQCLHKYPTLDIAPWIDWFFSSFKVFLQTPFGLAEYYKLLQGGTQGDSMGVGAYILIRVLRSRALRGQVSGLPHPGIQGEEVQEVIFSDDGRIFGKDEVHMRELLDASISIAARSGASVNLDKLKVFKITLKDGKLVCVKGSLDTSIGSLSFALQGLKIVGISALMGASVKADIQQAADTATKVVSKLRAFKPSPILGLRVFLAYVMSSLDYRLSCVPVDDTDLETVQKQCRQAARAVARVPQFMSDVFLTLPLSMGGMGFPQVALRLRLQRILYTFQALQGRACYPRELLKTLLHDDCWSQIPGSDPEILHRDLRTFELEFCCEPSQLPLNPVLVTFHRESSATEVIVATDGSCKGLKVRLAAVFVDSHGVFAECSCQVELADASAWIAEWLSKFIAVHELPMRPGVRFLFLGDAQSLAFSYQSLRTTGSHLVDCCMLYIARKLRGQAAEGYVPAQHDSNLRNVIANAQAKAHALAHIPPDASPSTGLPFVEALSMRAIMLHQHRVCVKPAGVLQHVYTTSVSRPRDFPLCTPTRDVNWSSWEDIIVSQKLFPEQVATALWLRTVPYQRSVPGSAFCPFCRTGVTSWQTHFHQCIRRTFMLAMAFKEALETLRSSGFQVSQDSVWSASMVRKGRKLHVALERESSPPLVPGTVGLTPSGMVYAARARGEEVPELSVAQCTELSVAFVRGLQQARNAPDPVQLLTTNAVRISTRHSYTWGQCVMSAMIVSTTSARLVPALALSRPFWVEQGTHLALRWQGDEIPMCPESATDLRIFTGDTERLSGVVLRISDEWTLQWDDHHPYQELENLRQQLLFMGHSEGHE